jgi:hypothetical protein
LIVGVELVEMRQQCVAVGMNRDLAGGNVRIDCALALLSFLGPEPALVGWDRQCGP